MSYHLGAQCTATCMSRKYHSTLVTPRPVTYLLIGSFGTNAREYVIMNGLSCVAVVVVGIVIVGVVVCDIMVFLHLHLFAKMPN